MGNGAIIYPDPSDSTQTTCTEATKFMAYKCTGDGATSMFSTAKSIWSDFVMIDNHHGTSANIGREGEALEIII
jgi:hypothetical protein